MKRLEKREVEQTRSENVANVGEEGKSTERRGSDDAEDEDDHEMDWIKACENHLHWSATSTHDGNEMVIYCIYNITRQPVFYKNILLLHASCSNIHVFFCRVCSA